MPIMQFIGNLGYVVVAILGGFLTIKKTIEVGDIQSFIQYVRSFTQPIQQIAQVANMLQMTAAASERVFEFLEEEEEDQTVEHPVSVENLEGNVSFDHVHFGYNADRIIVNDFSAEVKEMCISDSRWRGSSLRQKSGSALRMNCFIQENKKEIAHHPPEMMSDTFYALFCFNKCVFSKSAQWT